MDKHRIETAEDIAELTPEMWSDILASAELVLPTAVKAKILLTLKSLDDLPKYEYSQDLGRQVFT